MSSPTDRRRLPLSVPNIVVIGVATLGAVVAFATGNWPGGVFLGVITAGGLVAALMARRPNASDVSRINALEYQDERDSRLATRGFAVVGVVALCLAVAETVTAIVVAPLVLDATTTMIIIMAACAQQFALYVAWGIANLRAVRLG